MSRQQNQPDFQHGSPDLTGILLLNLGTPDAPTPAAVWRYLAEFLSDPRVVEIPRAIWLPLLHGVILPLRARRSAHAYRQIWTPEGSPLLLHSRRLAQALEQTLRARFPGSLQVALAMRYGQPSTAAALRQLRAAGLRRLLLLPLYPQYSATTTATAFDAVMTELQRWRWQPELRTVLHYHDDPGYIAALADSVRAHWRQHGRGGRLLLSFHGLPRRNLLLGDPYHCECQATARLLAQALELRPEEWLLSFQSRFGRAAWLQPYTSETLQQWGRERLERVDVICPGFPADCLETLEEIAIENRALFQGAGGGAFHYIPALNDSPAHAALLASLVERHTAGWDALRQPPDATALARQRERALAQGAAA